MNEDYQESMQGDALHFSSPDQINRGRTSVTPQKNIGEDMFAISNSRRSVARDEDYLRQKEAARNSLLIEPDGGEDDLRHTIQAQTKAVPQHRLPHKRPISILKSKKSQFASRFIRNNAWGQ